MPLPVPAWFGEVQQRDYVRMLFETLQFEKWRRWKQQRFPLKPFAATIDDERTLGAELSRVTECKFQCGSQPPLSTSAGGERSATGPSARRFANALRARAGQPIHGGSGCSDGRWSFDGKTLLFAKPIALLERRDTSIPLALNIRK